MFLCLLQLSFSLRTRGHAAHFVTKTTSSIAGSHYDASKPTVFIIHGYMSSGLGDRWPSHAASLILQKVSSTSRFNFYHCNLF